LTTNQAIFPLQGFCFHNFSLPLRKILAAPLIEIEIDYVLHDEPLIEKVGSS